MSGSSLPRADNLIFHVSASSLSLAGGAPVTSITDSISNITLSQATTTNQPTYQASVAAAGGKPGILLPGSKWLTATDISAISADLAARNWTVIIVGSNNTSTSSTSMALSAGAGGDAWQYVVGSYLGRYDNGSAHAAPWGAKPDFFVMGNVSDHTYPYGFVVGNEAHYCNGTCVASFSRAGGGPAPTQSTLTLGAINPSGTLSAKCTIHEILIWKTPLNPAEMLQATGYLYSMYGLTAPWAGAPYFLTTDGDSITMGVGSTNGVSTSYPYQLAQSLGLPYGRWTNVGVGGQTMGNMLSAAPSRVSNLIAQLGSVPMIVSAFEYFNERTNVSKRLIPDARSYCSAIKALANTQLVFGTSTSWSGDAMDTQRPIYDIDVVANPTLYGTFNVMLHESLDIGTRDAYANHSTLYWSGDGVHLNGEGYTILAALFQGGVRSAISAL